MARILLSLSVCLLSFITVATCSTANITVETGYIPFNYGCSKYQTWYAAYYPPEPIQSTPLIAVHGGPGFTHEHLDAIQDLASNRTVIFYDQIGNGNSTRFDAQTANDTHWSIDLYLSELENVIDHFSEFESFDVLGHEWGGMLGAEYAVLRPEKLRKLVLSNSPGAMYLWVNSQKQLLHDEGFSQDVQDGIAAGFSDPVRYRTALETYDKSHGCILQPWPAPLNASLNALFTDPTVGTKMASVLSNWTIVDRLKNITVPTLVINGANDTAQSFVVKPFMDNIPNATHFTFQNSSNTPMWEERAGYMSVVAGFLA